MEKIKEYTWKLKGKPHKCRACGVKINAGDICRVEVVKDIRFYPAKGLMGFVKNHYFCKLH